MGAAINFLPLALGIGLLLSLVPLNVLHIRILRYLFRRSGGSMTWNLDEIWAKGKTYAGIASAYQKEDLDDGALQDLFRRYRRSWRVTLGLFAAFLVAIIAM